MIVVGFSVVGFAACVALGLATYTSPLEDPTPLLVLFAGVYATFAPAVVLHPRAAWHGGSVNVTWRETLRTAPRWAIGAFAAGLLIAAVFAWPLPAAGFPLTREAFRAEPGRYRFVAAFLIVFYSTATLVRASGLRVSSGRSGP